MAGGKGEERECERTREYKSDTFQAVKETSYYNEPLALSLFISLYMLPNKTLLAVFKFLQLGSLKIMPNIVVISREVGDL